MYTVIPATPGYRMVFPGFQQPTSEGASISLRVLPVIAWAIEHTAEGEDPLGQLLAHATPVVPGFPYYAGLWCLIDPQGVVTAENSEELGLWGISETERKLITIFDQQDMAIRQAAKIHVNKHSHHFKVAAKPTKEADMPRPTPAENMFRLREVEKMFGIKKSFIYQGINAGTFPAPTRIGSRAVAWRESDLTAWQRTQTKTR